VFTLGQVSQKTIKLEALTEFTKLMKAQTHAHPASRLYRSHRHQAYPKLRERKALEQVAISANDVGELAHACLSSEHAALKLVQQWLVQDRDLEAIYLKAIMPAAQLIGAWWTSDEVDFATATVAFCRMHRLLYELSPRFLADAQVLSPAPSALLIPTPGCQHSMGVFMLSEFFRRGGWRVSSDAMGTVDDVVRLVQTEWFDVLGLSIASDRQLDLTQQMLTEVRLRSANPKLVIMLGGPWVQEAHPQLTSLKPDLIGTDAGQSPQMALQYVRKLQSCSLSHD
jgi:methylmalonyl-CoA mutase cobalamin-binding subunit